MSAIKPPTTKSNSKEKHSNYVAGIETECLESSKEEFHALEIYVASGTIYLTNLRLVFVSDSAEVKKGAPRTAEIPLYYVLQWDFDQPVLGANGMTFKSKQLYRMFNRSDNLVEFKLYFSEGNFGTFAQILESTMDNVARNLQLKRYVNSDREFIRNLTAKSNTILRDPNDPTRIVISKDYDQICSHFYNTSARYHYPGCKPIEESETFNERVQFLVNKANSRLVYSAESILSDSVNIMIPFNSGTEPQTLTNIITIPDETYTTTDINQFQGINDPHSNWTNGNQTTYTGFGFGPKLNDG